MGKSGTVDYISDDVGTLTVFLKQLYFEYFRKASFTPEDFSTDRERIPLNSHGIFNHPMSIR